MSDIEVRHLSKSFDLKGVKVEALKDINLSIIFMVLSVCPEQVRVHWYGV